MRAQSLTTRTLALIALTVLCNAIGNVLLKVGVRDIQPASAAGYAVVPLLAWLFAGERMSALRWGGVLLIAAGVVLVSRTDVRTTGTS